MHDILDIVDERGLSASPPPASPCERWGGVRRGRHLTPSASCTARALADSVERTPRHPDPSPPFASRMGGGTDSRRDPSSQKERRSPDRNQSPGQAIFVEA